MKVLFFLLLFLVKCSYAQQKNSIDLQGHRGCRGLMPENTIPAFIKAIELGVTTLEMDVVITKDKKVLVSHDAFMSSEFCLDINGNAIQKSDESLYNIYEMNYDEVKKYDCGFKPHTRFPKQQKIRTFKPLLEEVIDSVLNYCRAKTIPLPFFNIETKTTVEGDSVFHPAPREFCELLIEVLTKKNILKNCYIQSFDIRTLQYIHKFYPAIPLVLLVENNYSAPRNIEWLGFTPTIYSPAKELVNKRLVQYCMAQKMKLVVWTVNKKTQMHRFIKMGVDGIISDYPDILINTVK